MRIGVKEYHAVATPRTVTNASWGNGGRRITSNKGRNKRKGRKRGKEKRGEEEKGCKKKRSHTTAG